MAKPKPKRGNSRFTAASHQIADETKAIVFDLLGCSNPKVVVEIEKSLGLYVHGQIHLDDVPRHTDYVNAFKPINATATKLLGSLHELNDYFSNEVATHHADLDAIEASVMKLMTVSAAIVGAHLSKSSMGAAKNNALTEVTKRLRQIFRASYKGNISERKTQGGVTSLAEHEKLELRLVEAALLDARIIEKDESMSRIKRLFRDARCAMPNERSGTLNRIANKVAASRRQKVA